MRPEGLPRARQPFVRLNRRMPQVLRLSRLSQACLAHRLAAAALTVRQDLVAEAKQAEQRVEVGIGRGHLRELKILAQLPHILGVLA